MKRLILFLFFCYSAFPIHGKCEPTYGESIDKLVDPIFKRANEGDTMAQITTTPIIVTSILTSPLMTTTATSQGCMIQENIEDREKLYYLVLNLPRVMHGSATGSGEHFNNFSLFYGCREEPASFRQVLSENYEKIFTGKKQYQELEYIVATSEALSSTPNSCQSYNDTFVKLARHVLNYQKTKTK